MGVQTDPIVFAVPCSFYEEHGTPLNMRQLAALMTLQISLINSQLVCPEQVTLARNVLQKLLKNTSQKNRSGSF